MTLAELIAEIAVEPVAGAEAIEVSSLAYRSDQARPGTLFFCVPGERADGHDYAADAVARGAVALVVERPLELDVPQIAVSSARAAMAPVAARMHGDPTAALAVVGITGTNGKTTTAFLLRHLLERCGVRTALLGTVEEVVGGERRPVQRTTPEAIDLQRRFAEMRDGGDVACAMEVSSHALALHRVDAVRFATAVFTNLTQDHLDFHRDMEDYFAAKRMLFAAGPRSAIVNADDAYGRRLAEEFAPTTYSAGGAEADWRASDVDFDAGGARLRVHGPAGHHDVTLGLPGHFNVANALAALAAATSLGVDVAEAAAALADAPAVPGRMEPVDEGQRFAVLVDYAHTPDSLDNALRAARTLLAGGEGQLICVFGCGGDRDRAKRPRMGAIAAELADRPIVTSDNPRSEDPEQIIDEILAGTGGRPVEVEPDRRCAIERACAVAGPGDLVVIAGKGHETGQEYEQGRKVPFDDRDVAREALRATATAGR